MDWKETIKTYYRPERIFFDEPMAKHTTFRIGGPAECYVIPDDVTQIRQTLALARAEGIPCHVIGNGSNLLVSDDGVSGIVIRMEENVAEAETLIISAYRREPCSHPSRKQCAVTVMPAWNSRPEFPEASAARL